MKCLIIDDEKNAHYVLKNHIEANPHLTLVGQSYNAEDALLFLEHHTVDLIFLDIQMPGQNGFALMEQLNKSYMIILTTAFSEFALQSYEFAVLDYLLKPISLARFNKALAKIGVLSPKQQADPIVQFKVNHELIDFICQDIMYLQSWGNYIKLFTQQEEFICSSTTSEAERKLLQTQFIRIHKSYIVNIDYIIQVDMEYVNMKNQILLPVGITYRRNVLAMLKEKIKLSDKN